MQIIKTPHPFYDRREGLYFEPLDLYIDPIKPVEKALISHAHADHSSPGIYSAWCTVETAGLIKLRMGNRAPIQIETVLYGQPIQMNDKTTVTYYPAGHMLGSAMILINYEGTRYLYSGDFKLTPDPTCEPAATPECDVLFSEVTFGDVTYDHPDPEKEILKLYDHMPSRLVISTYKQGKAQRMTRLLHDHLPGVPVFIHPEIIPYHHCYEQFQADLGNWLPYNRREFLSAASAILIAPPARARGFERTPGIKTAFATGWKRFIPNSGIHLHISDHVDITQLISFARNVKAKKMVTFHGKDGVLKKRLDAENQLKLSL